MLVFLLEDGMKLLPPLTTEKPSAGLAGSGELIVSPGENTIIIKITKF